MPVVDRRVVRGDGREDVLVAVGAARRPDVAGRWEPVGLRDGPGPEAVAGRRHGGDAEEDVLLPGADDGADPRRRRLEQQLVHRAHAVEGVVAEHPHERRVRLQRPGRHPSSQPPVLGREGVDVDGRHAGDRTDRLRRSRGQANGTHVIGARSPRSLTTMPPADTVST